MFTEKYKPLLVENIVGNQGNIQNIQQWYTNWFHDKDNKDKQSKNICALLSGPSGIGKSLCVELFIKKYNLNAITLSPEDKIDKEYITKIIIPSLQIIKSFSNKNNIFVIHDIDCYDDHGFISNVVLCLKETKIPVIAICNNRYEQSLKPIITYCLDIKFQKPNILEIMTFLKPILQKEGIVMQELKLKQFVEDNNSDIRSILNNLQMHNKSCSLYKNEDKSMFMTNIFDITKMFLSQNIELKDKASLFWFNNELLPLMLHENYPHNNIKMKNEITHLNNIVASIENIGNIDLLEREIFMNTNWELMPYTCWFAIKAASNCHSKTQIKFTSYFEKKSKKPTMSSNIVKPVKAPKTPKEPKVTKAANVAKVPKMPKTNKEPKKKKETTAKTTRKKVTLIIEE